MMTNKKGFTLAEVLITIGIIGVIAAVTLPALNTNLIKNQLEVQTRKFYSQFTKAFDLYKAENQSNTITSMDFKVAPFVKKYFNVASKCKDAESCFAKEYSLQNNQGMVSVNQFIWEGNKDNIYQLADGSVFALEDYREDESYPIVVYFDVNGKKGPNKIGYDMWSATVFYDGSVDESEMTPEVKKEKSAEEQEKIIESKFEYCKDGTNQYGGCLGHFMRNGFKFDY